MRRRDAAIEPLRTGHYAMIAALASVVLIAAWFAVGSSRHGAPPNCLVWMAWLRDAIGVAALVVLAVGAGLMIASLFGPSRWWGLSAVVILVASLPILALVAFAFVYGDPAPAPESCQNAASVGAWAAPDPPLLD